MTIFFFEIDRGRKIGNLVGIHGTPKDRSAINRRFITGSKWRAHRKLIAPTFHLNVLKSFIDLFNANSRALVERMRKEGDKEFDCHDYMSECTVEILLETAMGVSKSTQDRSGFEYAMAVMKQVSKARFGNRGIGSQDKEKKTAGIILNS